MFRYSQADMFDYEGTFVLVSGAQWRLGPELGEGNLETLLGHIVVGSTEDEVYMVFNTNEGESYRLGTFESGIEALIVGAALRSRVNVGANNSSFIEIYNEFVESREAE